MTRREFIDNVCDFDDLMRFCYDEDCDIMEDVTADLKGALDEEIKEAVDHWYWYDIRDRLNDIPEGYTWYHRNGLLDWEDIDDSFDEWKADVMEWASDNDVFEEDDEEETEEYGAPQDEPFDTVAAGQGETEDLNSEFAGLNGGAIDPASDFFRDQMADLCERTRQIETERRRQEEQLERWKEEKRRAAQEAIEMEERRVARETEQEIEELSSLSCETIGFYRN